MSGLVGKFARVTGRLMCGYRGIIRIVDDSSGIIEGSKPNGTCDLCRHEVRVYRDQDAAREIWNGAERAAANVE